MGGKLQNFAKVAILAIARQNCSIHCIQRPGQITKGRSGPA